MAHIFGVCALQKALGFFVGLCFCLSSFSLYFHAVKCKNLCVLFPFLTGVMLRLARAVQEQPNVAPQGGSACPVHGAAAIVLAWFGVAVGKRKGPTSGITVTTACLLLRKNSLSSRCQALLRGNLSANRLVRATVSSFSSVTAVKRVLKCT